jgi:hypothetical protein
MTDRLEPLEEDARRAAGSPSSAESLLSSIASMQSDFQSSARWRHSKWRHPLGIFLLLVTVFLWTASNFLASVSSLSRDMKRSNQKTDNLRRQHVFEAIFRHLRQLYILHSTLDTHCPQTVKR